MDKGILIQYSDMKEEIKDLRRRIHTAQKGAITMTENEAISRIKDHMEIHRLKEPRAIYITVALSMAITALKEIQQYREIGTVEECREAVERQKPKKCVIDSCPDHTHYKCPSCGKIHLSRYKHGIPRLGRIPRFCDHCGQAIDENLEGMEDE